MHIALFHVWLIALISLITEVKLERKKLQSQAVEIMKKIWDVEGVELTLGSRLQLLCVKALNHQFPLTLAGNALINNLAKRKWWIIYESKYYSIYYGVRWRFSGSVWRVEEELVLAAAFHMNTSCSPLTSGQKHLHLSAGLFCKVSLPNSILSSSHRQ